MIGGTVPEEGDRREDACHRRRMQDHQPTETPSYLINELTASMHHTQRLRNPREGRLPFRALGGQVY
jgi:hypothetical protein